MCEVMKVPVRRFRNKVKVANKYFFKHEWITRIPILQLFFNPGEFFEGLPPIFFLSNGKLNLAKFRTKKARVISR